MLIHEIDCTMLFDDYNRRKKFACIELDSGHLKAIVYRNSGKIQFVFARVCRVCSSFDFPIFELENGHGEHFLVFFDENNKIFMSDTFDNISEVLANYIICEKEGKRFLIDISFKTSKLKLISGEELFKNCTRNFVILHNTRCRMCFLDKSTLQRLGPTEFISMSILKGTNWMIVTDSYMKHIIVRTTDFKYSIQYESVSGYFYTTNNNTVRSDNLLIATLEDKKYIFDTMKMQCIGNVSYLDIQPIDEELARVKIVDDWKILNLKSGLLS